MNYRHAFHAGNFADVAKHLTLLILLDALRRKDKPFHYLETHAGAGRYALAGRAARATGEAETGIRQLWQRQPEAAELAGYLALLRACNPDARPDAALRRYPGSPWLAVQRLRPGDRATLCELVPAEADALARLFRGDGRVRVECGDGFAALRGLLPPAERRGLVFIDPPFEAVDEFRRLPGHLQQACRRWPSGIFALWYPLKEPETLHRFHAAVAKLGIRAILRCECRDRAPDAPAGLHGGGLLIVNPPYRADRDIAAAQRALVTALAPGSGGSRVDWLIPE